MKRVLLVYLVILPFQIYCQQYSSNTKNDKKQIIQLEKTWLNNLNNKNELDSILASDFVHPLSDGIFINKEQHINWAVSHPAKEDYTSKFDTLFVRLYGNTAIANGIVETSDKSGKVIRKSIFTDVFVKRMNRWQAVNAQENLIK